MATAGRRPEPTERALPAWSGHENDQFVDRAGQQERQGQRILATLHGLPIAFALTGAKADERQTLLDILGDNPALVAARPGQTLIADKHYYGHDFEATLTGAGLRLLRPARKGEPERDGQRFFKPLRQIIESIFDTGKGQLLATVITLRWPTQRAALASILGISASTLARAVRETALGLTTMGKTIPKAPIKATTSQALRALIGQDPAPDK